MANIDDEWDSFISTSKVNNAEEYSQTSEMPEPTDIYISTKSKIAYLNSELNIKNVFWQIPVIPYWKPIEGVVKKQIKFVSEDITEMNEMEERLKSEVCVEQQIITHIINPDGRIKFKDIRKLSVGISKKDLLTYHSKKKSAFYNCFVIIVRILVDDVYREIHAKVFNTGKLEIPGIQTDEMFEKVLAMIIQIVQPNLPDVTLAYNQTSDTILINSNFSVGYYIDREKLYGLLKTKYELECIYDPCSYPGIQCKYYYDPECRMDTIDMENDGKNTELNKSSVSFMIFRTGSILIVGRCDEKILMHIYEFLKIVFETEYPIIGKESFTNVKEKNKKIRKKMIVVSI
jgi:hypothetical protein